MADLDQNVSALNKVQRWKEFVSGVYARTQAAILYGITTGSAEAALQTSTDGFLRVNDNYVATLLGSTSRTATTASSDQVNANSRGLILQFVYDTSTGAAVTPTLQIKDSISSGYFTVWTAAAAVSSTGQRAYLFDLGGSGSAGSYTEAVNLRLARTWRLNMTHSSSGATQYSVSAEVLA